MKFRSEAAFSAAPNLLRVDVFARSLNGTCSVLLIAALLAAIGGCNSSQGPGRAESNNGKYQVLDTRTDNFDFAAAKALAEDAIVANPDLGCMVGLFAYNPPQILEALKGAGKLGEIEVVAFDEDDATLQAIKDKYCYGTVVQNPYMYGYESVRILAGLARGDKSVLPEGGMLNIPARKITKENVEDFHAELKKLTAASEDVPAKDPNRPTVAYVTNGIAAFWVIAEKGARDAGKEFDVNVEVLMPPSGVNDQQRMVEDLLTRGVDGIAISPIDPDNQQSLLNHAAEQTHLITHDSDAPNTNRLCYIGMDNYDAGTMCGELVKEAMPDGGSVMIFVGRLEQLNAKLRREGLVDELLDRRREGTAAGDEAS